MRLLLLTSFLLASPAFAAEELTAYLLRKRGETRIEMVDRFRKLSCGASLYITDRNEFDAQRADRLASDIDAVLDRLYEIAAAVTTADGFFKMVFQLVDGRPILFEFGPVPDAELVMFFRALQNP